jgi:glycosyltransferase involved in cell wall biosynthesis
MKLALVSRHLPEPEGTATGRALWALASGLLAEGHAVDVCSWWPEPPERDLPPWCEWRPLPPEARLPMKLRALLRPRWDAARVPWRPNSGAVAVADEPLSFPVVARHRPSVLTLHYLARLDARAVGRPGPADYQDMRAQRRDARSADVVLAYSERVAGAAGVPAVPVPVAYDPPDDGLEPVEEPVAALVANWEWPPNRVALANLLDAWPRVREVVAGARLLLAGRSFERLRIGHLPGVEPLGPVLRSVDVLARAAVLAFPCPASSGPKIKVLEALALGIPVVTTPAGAEGVHVTAGESILVSPLDGFAGALAAALSDPGRRAAVGAAGRRAVIEHHAPRPAARARVAALTAALQSRPAGAPRRGRRTG